MQFKPWRFRAIQLRLRAILGDSGRVAVPPINPYSAVGLLFQRAQRTAQPQPAARLGTSAGARRPPLERSARAGSSLRAA